ncbi:nucleoside-diphosphate kinase [Candidatus Desantisbacteria bacterium]|nr:nucleoside-diphosphate kinase [Candidatus Desantisbacteria bacterium]
MAKERTLTIIKPDAVSKKLSGAIIQRLENNGFKIVGMKMVHMNRQIAEGFYAVHKERSFFNDLINFMTSGSSVVMALEREDAVLNLRKLMGATNPKDAEMGTIRKEFATDIEKNAIHGSDSSKSAETEIAYFFKSEELSK